MRNRIFSIMAGLLVVAGCAKETAPELSPAGSDFLVLKADVADLTRTDISEGNSTWEAGDVITVVYDGAAYEYVAQSAGETTTFTSAAGITTYDATKPLTAYYPATDVTGTIKIESEKTLAFKEGTQVNASCAPLVGTPKSDNLKDGALSVVFSNVFAVLELRIDAGELTGTATSIKVEPASAYDFEGYLSFTGTVDPSTLAVTPAENGTGNSLTLNLPANADPKKAMTLKFSVGRFSTGSGLKVTLTTSEGTYSRNVYKTGVTSYVQKGENFYAKHLAKPMYAFANAGGIATAEDFMAFAAAVNAGESIVNWMNSSGKVVLLNDIDMSSVTSWTPIGTSAFNWASNALSLTSGKMFTGYFDGQGYKLKNFKMVCDNSVAGGAWGLFGGLGAGAVVENIVFDETCSLEVKATAPTDCGLVAGMMWDATVRNITSNASMTFDGNGGDNKRMTMAVVGMAFAETDSTVISKVVHNGKIVAAAGGNTKNGGTAVHIAGILGFGTNHLNSSDIVAVLDCVNKGDIESATARASGLVAACNRYTHVRGCDTYGNNLNTFKTSGGSRLGNITCITGAGSAIYDSRNFGDLISTTSGAVGGVLCLVNSDDNILDGVETYGRVISDKANNSYKGSFFGQCSKKATIRNCVCGGTVGMYNGGTYDVVEVNADNYFDYIGQVGATAVNVTKENIRYGKL
jgi:hypothetical protein